MAMKIGLFTDIHISKIKKKNDSRYCRADGKQRQIRNQVFFGSRRKQFVCIIYFSRKTIWNKD